MKEDRARCVKAFTLIELLVAMAVLALLVSLLAVMTSTALSTWTRGEKSLASGETTRPIEQLISRDFARLTTMGGLPAFPPDPSNATRSLPGFYVTAPGAISDPRHLTYIEYHWDAGTARLDRRQRAYNWSDPPPFKNATATPTPPSPMPPLSGILAFHLKFLDDDGNRHLVYNAATSRIARVAFVQADASAAQILGERGQLEDIVEALNLSDSELLGTDNPLALWREKIDNLVESAKLDPNLAPALQPTQLTLALPR